jgi:hypothetical protein
MRTVLEARQQRGLELATTVKIVRKRNEWISFLNCFMIYAPA